jgi:hypothetical protein
MPCLKATAVHVKTPSKMDANPYLAMMWMIVAGRFDGVLTFMPSH